MFFIGIDVAKRSHQAAVTDISGNIIVKPFNFKNSSVGFSHFLETLKVNSVSKENCTIGLESTGHYWYPLYFFLAENDFTVKVFNPIQTAAFCDITIRKVKNDNLDSIMIADFTRFGRYSETYIPSENMLALKNLSRYRLSISDICADLKKSTIALLDQVFPEYSTVFSDIFGSTSKQLLEKYSTPDEFSEISTTKLANLIHKISHGRNGREKAELIKSAAQNSIGITYAIDTFSFQIKQLIEQIEFMEDKLSDIDAEMAKLLAESEYSVITTISGIGPTLGSIIVSEIGDIERFDSSSKLVAYAGLDASVYCFRYLFLIIVLYVVFLAVQIYRLQSALIIVCILYLIVSASHFCNFPIRIMCLIAVFLALLRALRNFIKKSDCFIKFIFFDVTIRFLIYYKV